LSTSGVFTIETVIISTFTDSFQCKCLTLTPDLLFIIYSFVKKRRDTGWLMLLLVVINIMPQMLLI